MTNDAASGSAEGIALLLKPWQQLAVQLSPLIGDSGFCALLGRATRLAKAQFAWLAPVPAGRTVDAAVAALHIQFAAAGQAEAARANHAILATFTKLLTGLIGEALTMQLLDAALADVSAIKPVQEQK